jgi:hypothetical protein
MPSPGFKLITETLKKFVTQMLVPSKAKSHLVNPENLENPV